MARYNRITRKKADGSDIVMTTPSSLIDFMRANTNAVAITLGALALVVAGVYGASLYMSSSMESAQNRLYHASRLAPREGATVGSADESLKAFKEFVDKGGPSELVIQGRLEMAALYSRKGDFQSALEQYASAGKDAKKGGLLWELAGAGEAYALATSGKHTEAAAKFKELSEAAKYYPKQELVYNYSLSLAAVGDKAGAVKALKKLKAEFPNYLPQDYLTDTLARVESGRLSDAKKSAEPAATSQAPAAAVH
jgi:tetratricopeptide (TPR) repeat protein